MKCYFCDKELMKGENDGFVCICDECLELAEKSEARMVKKVCALTKWIGQQNGQNGKCQI